LLITHFSASLLPLAASAGHSGFLSGPLRIVVFAILFVGVTIFRSRKGGPGPQVNWVPKSMRAKLNDRFEEEGWQKPYDDDGNRNPDRKQL
jgi:hypothetical protein